MPHLTELDALEFLDPAVRESASAPMLRDALLHANEDFANDESETEDAPYPLAYQAVIWHLVTELDRRGAEGHRLLLEVLRLPDSPLCPEIARVTLALVPTETREALEARAEELGDSDPYAPIIGLILEDDEDLDVASLFPEPEDQMALLRLHRFKKAAAADGAKQPGAEPLMDRIGALIDAQGFGRWKADIEGLFLPGYGLRARAADEPPSVGASRLGGWPDLPPGLAWPTSDQGAPLSLLAQFRLSDLQASPLPATGMLYFFYDAANQPWHSGDAPGAWRVVFHPSEEGLEEARPSANDVPPNFTALSVFAEAFVSPDLQWSSWASEWRASYSEVQLIQELQKSVQEVEPDFKHQLLGCASLIQDAHPNEGQPPTDPYRLLFQIGSDRRTEMLWGDSGCLYFWVRQSALNRHDFSQILGILQCY